MSGRAFQAHMRRADEHVARAHLFQDLYGAVQAALTELDICLMAHPHPDDPELYERGARGAVAAGLLHDLADEEFNAARAAWKRANKAAFGSHA